MKHDDSAWNRLARDFDLDISDLADVASDWFWVMDADLRYVYFSPSVTEITGAVPEWHYGKTRQDLGIAVSDGSDPLLSRKPYRNRLISRPGPDGRTLWMRSSGKPIFDRHGVFKGYIGTGLDVTAEVEAQKAAEERHKLLISAMEAMSEGFALFDPNDRLVFCNSRFRALNPNLAPDIRVGMTFEEMVRSNLRGGRIIEAIGREDDFLRRRLDTHRNPAGEPVLSERSDGRILLLREVRLDDGSTFLINTDQTELHRREIELIKAKEEAETANRAKSSFLARMSHELRTPLNAILGYSEAVAEGALTSARFVEYARDIHRSGLHLLSLINDLLDLTAIETERVNLAPERLRPRQIVARALATMAPIARQHGIRLRARAPRSLPEPVLDRRSIDQCLLNLLSNAVKFSPSGSAVALTVETPSADSLAFVVSDSGTGMDRADLLSTRTAYTRPAEQSGQHGAGLGLQITRSLATAMGGSLSIQSTRGLGTKATLRFPVERKADGTAEPASR